MSEAAPPVDDAVVQNAAESTATTIIGEASSTETRRERRSRAQVAGVLAEPNGRQFLLGLTDQVLRIHPPGRAARRLAELVGELGVPHYLGPVDRASLRAGVRLAEAAPGIVMPLATARLRSAFSSVVLAAERRRLARHIARRRAQHIALNVNLLGEAVLGEGEALRRTEQVLELLARREVDYVSVKISAICAQLDVLAYEESVARITERLRRIYAEAARHSPAKFVNLDMEEYRDLHLTVDAFIAALSDGRFSGLDAGIVLQAYLPDSIEALEQISDFARARRDAGGAGVKVRIVKGANLAMERVDAELHGWPQAPFGTKLEVDANYKRLLEMALAQRNAGAVRLGVASHNAFEIGWALALADALGARDRIELEMLEGMADAQARVLARRVGRVLFYAPVVYRDDFEAAVAYLTRRFDENTEPENYLTHAFELTIGSAAYLDQQQRFRRSVAERRTVPGGPRRCQDRRRDPLDGADYRSEAVGAFTNVSDTDFSLAANRSWIADELEAFAKAGERLVEAVVDGRNVTEPATGIGADPSAGGAPRYRYVEIGISEATAAVAAARRSASSWRALGAERRRQILRDAASVMAAQRGRAIATMAYDAGKTVGEGDPEVSEAIDFARYYGDEALVLEKEEGDRFVAPSVVLVAPPWNFPYAIPAGGVFAALAIGASVLLKPAPESVLTAALLAEQCWEAGIPRDVLQFVPCNDEEVGSFLVSHHDVDTVILTGSIETARLFLDLRPGLALHAETSGKNAIVVSAAADEDEAIRDLLRSAFSHAGQKCSAASLAILEASVYDDERFLARLGDAVKTLRVGPAYHLSSEVGPLIRPPSGALARALTVLGPGESWLVEPQRLDEAGYLWTPGVKLGVRRGSEFHLTECFGPVLGLMRAESLEEAIRLQNAPAFGLTGGLHSLDEAEIRGWSEQVKVGNAYVNRHITGAIVRRQPFGGWKRSAVGSFAKAGGPGYLASLGTFSSGGDVADEIEEALGAWRRLAAGEDPIGLRAERNEFRLRALARVSLRLGADADLAHLDLALAIAHALEVAVDLSAPHRLEVGENELVVEDDDVYLRRLAGLGAQRARLCGVDPRTSRAALELVEELDVAPLQPRGRRELMHWAREQALSITWHRHGNVHPNDWLSGRPPEGAAHRQP